MDSSRTSLDDDYDTYPAHTRLPNEQVLELYAELTLQGEYHLLPYEEVWKARRPFLESKGYELRPRYSEDWWPSWIGTDINPFFCEDSIDSCLPHIMDATLWDGDEPFPVLIKAIPSWTDESNIACMFSFEEKVDAPQNHCVPVMDVFASPTEAHILFLVMPLLRAFNDPPFAAVEEVVDFIDQILQGIEFMHLNNVAHRDITCSNIMMDGSGMYPEGFHPVRQHLDPSARIEVVPMTRTMSKPKYYIIDFDGSVCFPGDMPGKFRTATGKHGADDEVPEMSQTGPYDPFKVDIFQFGNVLRREFLEKYVGLEFLESMVRDMTRPDPPDRPSVGSIIARFTRLRSNLRPNQLKRALSPKASSDPLRDHLRLLGISRDPLEPDPGLDGVEEEDSDDPTLGLRTTSSGETHDSAGSAAAEDYWDSEATRRSVSTTATSLTTSPAATSPPPIPGIGSAFSQWLPGRPKSPVTLKKGPPTPIIVPQNPLSPASQGDFFGGRRGPLPFFARSLSPDTVPPSPSSPTSPINIHHHRKGSGGGGGGGPTGTLAFLKTGKFPWTMSESPSSRASTPDIEKFKLESEFIAYTAANGGANPSSPSPTSPSNSWSKAMNGLHGFMGKKKGRERSNSKLSISSETGPWSNAGAAASASTVDMANWGSNPEDVVIPPSSNPTPPSGGLAAFWGLGKSSSSPPVKKEKKSKSTSTTPASNAAGWDIPNSEASSSTFAPLWPATNGEVVKESKPSSKASTAKPTPAPTPPSAAPAPITKLSKKANKKAAQSTAASASASASASTLVPTQITEEDLPPKATEEEEWTPGPSSTSPPSKGIPSFWGAGKEEKRKKKAEKAEVQVPLSSGVPFSTPASLVAAMADTWNEESEEAIVDISHWAGRTEHGFGLAPGPTFNTSARDSPLSLPGPEWESPRIVVPPLSTPQLGSASSSSNATPTTSGKSAPGLAMPVGKADKRTLVSNQAPAPGNPLAAEENPDASDWMAFTNKTKTGGLRPSKLGNSVISADPEEKPATPVGGKTGTTSGWAVKQALPKQESLAWGAFGASPTEPAFQARTKAMKAPEPTKRPAQGGTGPHFGGWGSINTPLQPPVENKWDTWSVRSVPAIEIVSPPNGSPAPRDESPSFSSPPMSTWKPPGSTTSSSTSRTPTVTTMDMSSGPHTARSSWTSLVKEPHGFTAAQWKFNGSGSVLGPVSEGFGENAAVNDVWEMEIGGSDPPSDTGLPWQGEISPELLRSLQGPLEYSSGSDRESRKRKSEIGSGLRRPQSGFKSAFANLSDSGEEKGKPSLVPNKNPLNNVSDSSSSRSSWSAFPKKATSSPSGFGLSKSPPSAPAVIASTAKGKTTTSAAVRPTAKMPGGFMWDEGDGESKDVDLDQVMAMLDEPKNFAGPASNLIAKNEPPTPPPASMPMPTQAAKGKKVKKGRGKINGFDEEEPEPEPEAPMAPASSAVDDDLLAQPDRGLQSQARPEVKSPPSPYKTRTKTVWIEHEVPTRTGSLDASSIPNPLEEKAKLEQAKKLEEEEKEKEEAAKGNKRGNNNNKRGKKRR